MMAKDREARQIEDAVMSVMSDRGTTRAARQPFGALGRRDFLSLVGAGAAGLLARRLFGAEGEAKGLKPNILVIISDDQGYADVGFQGCKDIPTPSIDSLAANGVRFTSGYVSCPVCSPTRAGVNTGRYQQRFGHELNPGPAPGAEVGLPLTEATLADLMKKAGYATGMVGKWHLGMEPKFHPLQRGFGEYYGFLGGAHPYLDLRPDGRNPILRATTPVDEKEYLTDAFTREAVAFIERHKAEPFFLYLTFNAVHAPLQATPKYLDRFKDIRDEQRQTYAAMLSAMDDGIGAVLKKLREAGIEENTLVFFFSDNGGAPGNASRNGPLRATKGTVYEGGIRVPSVIQWKGSLPAGKAFDHPVISLDVLPTAVAAAGGALPADRAIDGVNLLPYLKGEKEGPPHDALFWRFGQQSAIRKGNWKLAKIRDQAPELYDLAADIGEKTDLSAQKPEVVKDLTDAWAKWNAELKDPLWGGRQRAARPLRRQGRGAQP
jgi:arylsulfatase A-like enzyme